MHGVGRHMAAEQHPLHLVVPDHSGPPREFFVQTAEALRELAAAFNRQADDVRVMADASSRVTQEVILIGHEMVRHGTMIAAMMGRAPLPPMRPPADSIADPIEEAARELSRRANDRHDPMTPEKARALAVDVKNALDSDKELTTWRMIKGWPGRLAMAAALAASGGAGAAVVHWLLTR